MWMGKIVYRWKIITLIGLIGLLVVLAPSETGSSVNPPHSAPWLRTGEENPFNSLESFVLLPESIVLIEGRYILALYEDPETGLYALAVFAADCDPEGCTIGELVAYSVFDADDVNSEGYEHA